MVKVNGRSFCEWVCQCMSAQSTATSAAAAAEDEEVEGKRKSSTAAATELEWKKPYIDVTSIVHTYSGGFCCLAESQTVNIKILSFTNTHTHATGMNVNVRFRRKLREHACYHQSIYGRDRSNGGRDIHTDTDTRLCSIFSRCSLAAHT